MHTVMIKDGDLDYFRSIVSAGLRGEYGPITELRIDVHATGQLQLSVGDYASGHFGTPSARLGADSAATIDEAIDRAEREGSGNPYANVTDDDPANVLARLDRLERFAAGVARQYGLDLPELQTNS